jgi:4,5-DOPA dioxygenase extradiol
MDATTTTMPALYIGHGAPPLLDDPVWSGQLRAWAADLPRPTAILIVSAHWESAPVSLSATAPATPLVYDFGGFHPKYYRERYETPDAAAFAARVAAMMPDTEPVHQHPSRGLDHGAWVPLKIMYPAGDIPVLQLSLPTSDPGRLLELGRRLRPLRDEGVLIIGSGLSYHNLREMRGTEGVEPSRAFDAWLQETLIGSAPADRTRRLRAWEQAPSARAAHPQEDHLIPLMVALGAAEHEPAAAVYHQKDLMGGITASSFRFGEPPTSRGACLTPTLM